MSSNRKHGRGGTKLYKVWQAMISRCENPDNCSFDNYGATGIKVCDEWHDVEIFCEWAERLGYRDGLTLERIDNSLGYNPDNCIWADRYVQNNNTSRNHMLTFHGKTMSMAQWSRELGISYCALKSRITKRGWSVERALTTKVK